MVPILLTVAGMAALLLPRVAAQCQNPGGQGTGNIVMANGYQSKLLMTGLRVPRHISLDLHGNLLIAEMGGGGIRRVTFQDNGGLDICVTNSHSLIPNGQLNHGVAVAPTGRTVFASSATDVYQYEYDPVAGTVGQPKHLLTGMRQGGFHQTRTLLVPFWDPNKLIVSRGSEDNVDVGTLQESTGRSIIRYWNIDEFTGTPLDYSTTGTNLGWGLRNSVGVGEDPTSGAIWSVENSVDNFFRLGRDIHNDNPGEELNYHGLINSTEPNPYLGRNYGYPACYAVWQGSDITGINSVRVGMQVTGGQLTVGQYTDQYCEAEVEPPRLTFPSHTAPLDIKFKPDGSSAYISFHGSWNRSPPDGYRLSRIDFQDGQPIAAPDSMNAEVPIMWNSNNNVCPNQCFRPTGLAVDHAGRIFMTSDTTGELYVITEV